MLETNAIIPTTANERKGIESINRLCGQTLLTTILEATYNQIMRELTHSVKNKAFFILMFSLSFLMAIEPLYTKILYKLLQAWPSVLLLSEPRALELKNGFLKGYHEGTK